MKDLTEIRWHGRGGQGAKTAALLFADAALAQGKYIQAFPEYGPERMGAPVAAFDRLSSKPILLHSGIENPDIVVVLDPTLMDSVSVGSSTITISGLVTPECIEMGFEEMRLKEATGAPILSGPYSGNAWIYLPDARAASPNKRAAVFAPWPPLPCQRISVKSFIFSCKLN